jgi:very-short-patch-repair endonuclease
LAIELDGNIHDKTINKEYDEARTAMLAGLNVIVLRFKNEDVTNNLKDVLRKINNGADMLNSNAWMICQRQSIINKL